MAQLHCYVPDKVAESLKQRAEKAGMSVSRYLAELAKRDIDPAWPYGYFERVFGTANVDSIQRPDQGEFEQRATLTE